MGIGSNIGKALLAQAPDMAPGAAVLMLRSILGFAIDGASSLPGARQAAGKTLTKHDGDVEQAISSSSTSTSPWPVHRDSSPTSVASSPWP